MANQACGGMKTLGVCMEQPGKTNQIIADVYAKVESLKPKFTDKDPIVKFDAPVSTEIGDLCAWKYNNQRRPGNAKWTLDIIQEWDGSFDQTAKDKITKLMEEYRVDQWSGQFDDTVKGVIACGMKAGQYHKLPAPFSPKSEWEVPFTMQLAVPPVGAGKWHIVKHFMFEDTQKIDVIHDRLARGTTCPICWWSANPFGTKKIFPKDF